VDKQGVLLGEKPHFALQCGGVKGGEIFQGSYTVMLRTPLGGRNNTGGKTHSGGGESYRQLFHILSL